MRSQLVFFLNGQRCELGPEQAGMMLADYLRYSRGLTGTKIVCAEGDCGACTVLRFFPGSSAYLPINSCIITVAQLDGSSLVTVDALAAPALTEVQKAMLECHGSQCGFCTPGFVMALSGLAEKRVCEKNTAPVTEKEAKNALTGNLCRCTGYQPIITAATTIELDRYQSVRKRFSSKAQEAELKKVIGQPLRLEHESFSFYAPLTLKEAVKYLAKHPDARLVGAATDLGVVHNKRKIRLQRLLSLHLVPELYRTEAKRGRLRVGARVTLTELREAVKKSVPEFARFLDLFASPQIKNVATLVGNVGNASPIADTPPFLLAADAVVHVQGTKGKREIPIDEFYLDYRKTALKRGELISAIEFSLPEKQEKLGLFKASQRKDLDISGVNAAFRLRWGKDETVKEARVALGGVAATPLRLKKTEAVLAGSKLSAETLERAVTTLQAEIRPLSDLRGSASYRRVVAGNFLRRFASEIGKKP